MALTVESARKEYARLGRELSAGENDYGSIAKIGRQGKLLECFKVVGSYLLENDPEFVTAPVITHQAVQGHATPLTAQTFEAQNAQPIVQLKIPMYCSEWRAFAMF